MSTYDEKLLAARFAALAPEPRAGDWEDILDRAGRGRKSRRRFVDSLRSGPRRRLLVLAAVALIVVLGAASAFAVRAVFHQGIVGLAPVGATPSTPTKGELVLFFAFGHSWGDHGRFTLSVYADGRMIWQRVGDYSRADELRVSTGLLERRLTPDGVERVKSEVRATGLVDRDRLLTSGNGLYFGIVDLRTGDRRVRVAWGGDVTWNGFPKRDANWEAPTAEQVSALIRLDERLADPTSWLPASAWVDSTARPYVPSGYSVCYEGRKGVGRVAVLGLLPPAAEDLLRAHEATASPYTNLLGTFVLWCSELATEEAHKLERILDEAGLRGRKDVFGLSYGAVDIHALGAGAEFSLMLGPILPDRG